MVLPINHPGFIINWRLITKKLVLILSKNGTQALNNEFRTSVLPRKNQDVLKCTVTN